ncbi:hypothetical protein [Stenotrophomonas sp. PS02297]|uniref:hypothetical protein n=1 Tax=Stenotrophomonas sp. PS02297 TaxID=2991423 RepID=UPI00249B1F06|nr:hypothetical protein [Stenotrophomonas sp. PS02297]
MKSSSFGYLFFARAKRSLFNSRMAGQSSSLLRSRGESSAFKFLPWLLFLSRAKTQTAAEARTEQDHEQQQNFRMIALVASRQVSRAINIPAHLDPAAPPWPCRRVFG